MTASPPSNGVKRTIQLLRALNRRSISTVEDLHAETGLPKATVSRMLQSLQDEGLVVKARYGKYYVTSSIVALANGYRGEPKIVQTAMPVMDELTKKVLWPITVGTLEHGELVIRYTTTSLSALSFFHSSVGMRLSLVSHAMGRAFLAHCNRRAQDLLLESIMTSRREADLLAGDSPQIRTRLREVRGKGYALRDARLRPESSTLSVPIFEGRQVSASLGLTWFTSVMTHADVVGKYLPLLRKAAHQIGRQLQQE
jgi:IclR family mhp operon transcriptional activator